MRAGTSSRWWRAGAATGATSMLEEAARLSEDFSERHRGKVAGMDAPGLAGAMRELEDIFDRVGRAGSYASLAFAVDTQDAPTGALMQQVLRAQRGASRRRCCSSTWSGTSCDEDAPRS